MADAARALLEKNGELTVEAVCGAMKKIIGNVLAHPDDPKYRRVKASAKIVQQTILAARRPRGQPRPRGGSSSRDAEEAAPSRGPSALVEAASWPPTDAPVASEMS